MLVGDKGWLSDDLRLLISELTEKGCLKHLGYVPEEDLHQIYAGAHAFMMLSFYEGFGLPVLEAMASGLPVLTSSHPSLAEVSSNIAMTVDPYDLNAIKNAIEALCLDQSFCDEARKKGPLAAQHYSWQQCAEKTLETYKKLL